MLKIVIEGFKPFTKREENKMRVMVERSLKENGTSGRSASGRSIVYAVEYCEKNKLRYTLHGWPGGGYYLETEQKF